jgi:hypothetical protein
MNIGAQEIIIVVLVIIAILFVTRVIKIGRSTVGTDEDTRPGVMASQYHRKIRKVMDFFLRTGIALVAVGVILLILGAAIFKWAILSYMWSAIIIAVGGILIIIFKNTKW